ncbi:MAG: hypothetical protein Q3991_01090 [Rothia sp. (in: high G+C Gram-positive bacteria)]|uniref:hypothetical protein n=1 Tax=Rothia sp. (in: high G+C Gram-positive bacteria) TaxID=1885016 RepID=UPI0026DB7658|nr:hypothetical protein [Rothia sp. (in: high G+C Gram-positive bacteria)]MDO4883522.1 hypothetical protein [Rothia sp. (in: high G+C Gram-positive bacteria)]
MKYVPDKPGYRTIQASKRMTLERYNHAFEPIRRKPTKTDLIMLSDYDKKLLSEIIKNQEKSLLEIKEHLINLQNENVSQDELYSFLGKLRSDAKTEIEEDRILEIMDLVCGWCSLDLQIYPQK